MLELGNQDVNRCGEVELKSLEKRFADQAFPSGRHDGGTLRKLNEVRLRKAVLIRHDAQRPTSVHTEVAAHGRFC